MKKTKKLISMLLVFAVMLSVCSLTTLAAEIKARDDTGVEAKIIKPLTSSNGYKRTSHEGILKKSDDKYALQTSVDSTTVLLPVGRLDVNVNDDDAFSDFLENEFISDTMKAEIAILREQMQEIGYQGYTVTVYSTELAEEDSGVPDLPVRKISGGRRVGGLISNGWTYGPYSGIMMAIEEVVLTGLDTGYQFVGNGAGARNLAANLIGGVVTITGLASGAIGAISTGVSLLTWFAQTAGTGTSFSGSYSDYLQVCVNYNMTIRNAYIPGLVLGASTRKVTINEIHTKQYYYNSGYGNYVESHRYPNTTMQTPSFANILPVAFIKASTGQLAQMEYITIKFGDTTFVS
ncbi:MAG: hypothetical protein LBN02_02580 [Oscillospiraceae bacterium]|jgi:hypothetical protein|nr:hypothetical protein [Oscillospiraceae bacterium]